MGLIGAMEVNDVASMKASVSLSIPIRWRMRSTG
jgi:hypothetical protein